MKIFYIARQNSEGPSIEPDNSPGYRTALFQFIEEGLFDSKSEAGKDEEYKKWLLENIKGVTITEFTHRSLGETYQFYGIHLRK